MTKNTTAAFAVILFAILFAGLNFFGPKSAKASVVTNPAVSTDYPEWIIAPSINLISPVQGVGVTSKGEMAVPSGSSNNVGWYNEGVVPGNTGTAVLDAHVFAAFKNLNKVAVGGDIYVYMHSGKLLHFVVTKSQNYALNSLSSATLFAPTSAQQLNLITCSGQLTANHSTYDHRLIVSAQLV